MKRVYVLSVMLLAPLLAAALPAAAPGRFIQAELLGLHVGGTVGVEPATPWQGISVLRATYISDRLRLGITALENRQFQFGLGGATAYAPVHVGYGLLTRHGKSIIGRRFVPAVYVEAGAGYAWFGGHSLLTRLTAAYETDWLGVGVGAEAGAVCLFGSDVLRYSNQPRLYAALKLRLLTAAFRV